MAKTLVLVVTALLPVIGRWLISTLNYKKKIRYRQVSFPIIATAYAVTCGILLSEVNNAANLVMNLSWMRSLLYWIDPNNNLIYGTELYLLLLIALLMIAGLFVLKAVLNGSGKLLQNRIMKRHGGEDARPESLEELTGVRRLYWSWINLFYDITAPEATPRRKWIGPSRALKYALYIVDALYIGLLVFAQIPLLADFPWYPYAAVQDLLEKLYVWPALSLLPLWEINYFFSGSQFGEEQTDDIFASNLRTQTTANYTLIEKHFIRQFPERFVTAFSTPEYPPERGDPVARTELAKDIHDRLDKLGGSEISKTALDCLASLPEHANVLIDATLYSDLGLGLMLYMNVALSQGENILVLCADEAAADDVASYIADAFTRINIFAPVWIVRSVKDAYAHGDCDVLVLTPQAVLDDRVHGAQKRFFDRLSTVLLVDSACLAAQSATALTLMSAYIDRLSKYPMQFICLCNGFPGDLGTTLEAMLSPGRSFTPFECFRSQSDTRILVWNYESFNGTSRRTQAQNNLFGTAMNHVYLGVALPFACVGLKYGMECVSVMGNRLPGEELSRALKASAFQMKQFFGDALQGDGFEGRIRFNSIGGQNPMIVVIDDTYNLPMTLRNYCRYHGDHCAMIHVISKPYMLRDYFSAHAGQYLLDLQKAEMFAALPANTRKITATKLICEAAGPNGLSEERLLEKMSNIDENVKTLRDALWRCCDIAFRSNIPVLENIFTITTETVFRPEKSDFERFRCVRLKAPELLQQMINALRPAIVEVGNTRVTLGMSRADIWQYYLPDEAIVVQGSMYNINRIDSTEGIIHAGRPLEKLDLSVDYIQYRHYLADFTDARTVRQPSLVTLPLRNEPMATEYEVRFLENVHLDVETYGFLFTHPSAPGLKLTDRSGYHPINEETRQAAHRHSDHAEVLSIKFSGILDNEGDRVGFTLAVLLSELMKTLFPFTWQRVAVCPVLTDEGSLKKQDSGTVPFENLIMAYPQVTVKGDPLKDDKSTAQVLIINDSQYDTGILETLFLNRQLPFHNIFGILLDYLCWQNGAEKEGNISPDYLFFGGSSLPGCFNLDYVKKLMRQTQAVDPSGVVRVPEMQDDGKCYFCGKNLYSVHVNHILDEEGRYDRIVCDDCFKVLVSNKRGLSALYHKTRDYMKNTFGATLPRGIRVRFVSSKVISRYACDHGRGRLVGLAIKKGRIILIETKSPPQNILATLVHELTHIWQFNNLNCNDQELLEGQAGYLEVQFLRNESYRRHAEQTHEELLSRQDDDYGRGYVRVREAMRKRSDDNTFTWMKEQFGKKKQR